MARRLLKTGDRIRLKVRTIFGWKGIGIVTEDQFSKDDCVHFRKEDEKDWNGISCGARPYEVSLIRSNDNAMR